MVDTSTVSVNFSLVVSINHRTVLQVVDAPFTLEDIRDFSEMVREASWLSIGDIPSIGHIAVCALALCCDL
jgi:hypothetical protein